uniref:Uncharacterized protein n=1 Tax=Romanomermis culicivorax TaxID=13658 RepID=A0A915K9Y2_ROMCU
MSTPADIQIKKLYKESVECVKYLDRLMTQESIDLSLIFSSKTVTIRNRLCEYCEKILFLKPLLYGKRADEIIWRKCFYEPIHKIRKRLHVDLSENDRCQYYLLLSSASGHYTSLLIRIQQELQFELPFSPDFSMRRQLPWNNAIQEDKSNDSESLKDFALNLSHRVLIYLGDLARYQQELCQPGDIRLAQYYYQWALRLKPFHGQPHNQLGTLFGDKNFGLDAAFCYLRW